MVVPSTSGYLIKRRKEASVNLKNNTLKGILTCILNLNQMQEYKFLYIN